ncbi:hypothetical protein POTOM_003946 [Populus tomentosa]|uniref:Secreted protein n=1 Tax=Populus tomentosa TaxID=118781 RepID=A0A8X8AUT7_POPTO|nr:hypothetical protein POTOM_003946 [Populus tomentosa]
MVLFLDLLLIVPLLARPIDLSKKLTAASSPTGTKHSTTEMHPHESKYAPPSSTTAAAAAADMTSSTTTTVPTTPAASASNQQFKAAAHEVPSVLCVRNLSVHGVILLVLYCEFVKSLSKSRDEWCCVVVGPSSVLGHTQRGQPFKKLAYAAICGVHTRRAHGFLLVKGEGIARRSVFAAAACFENVHISSSFAEINALVMWDFSFKELDK